MAPARGVSLLVFAAAPQLAHGDPTCWGGGVSPELCCVPKARGGNPSCWDGEFTFERCCDDFEERPPGPSDSVATLKVDPNSVPRLKLLGGGKGMPMSGVGLCCRPTAHGDAVRQGVLDYLLLGGRHLDDAQIYGNHEFVGEGVRQAVGFGVPRDEIFLTTKIPPDRFGFEAADQWVQSMLSELGLDYVDLVLMHWAGTNDNSECKKPKSCRQETWMALQRARQRGQIKHLGVSNFGPRQMEEVLALGGAPIEVNQLEFHPWAPQVHLDTTEWCHQHGIAVTAYGSMGSSNQAGAMMSQDSLQQIGAQHGKTAGQVLLRWAVQKNVSVIPGTSNPKHQAENMRIFDFEISAKDMASLDSIPQDQRMLHFNHWPDQRE